jgi:hypothetical protein
MLTDRTGAARRIPFSKVYETFEFLVWNNAAVLILIGIFLNLLPKVLFDWITIDPTFRVGGPLWRYSVGTSIDLLCNSAFSVLVVRVCLSRSENLSSKFDIRTILIYGRYLLFNVLVNTFLVVESSINLFNPALAHTLSGFIGIPNVSLRIMAFALFGLFLPTVFEGATFGLGLRRSYEYLSGYRFIATLAYVLTCILDFIPLPVIEVLRFPLLLNFSSEKYNLMALYAVAKAVSVIFETAWLVIVTSLYLAIKKRTHDQKVTASTFD